MRLPAFLCPFFPPSLQRSISLRITEMNFSGLTPRGFKKLRRRLAGASFPETCRRGGYRLKSENELPPFRQDAYGSRENRHFDAGRARALRSCAHQISAPAGNEGPVARPLHDVGSRYGRGL